MAVVNGELTHIVAAMETAEPLLCLQGAGLTSQPFLPQEGRCHGSRMAPERNTCPAHPP